MSEAWIIEEEENSLSITVMNKFKGEKSPPKPDDQPTQDGSDINSNEFMYHKNKIHKQLESHLFDGNFCFSAFNTLVSSW